MLYVQGRNIPETLEEVVYPKHTILAIHDMQNYFCNPKKSGPTYTPNHKPANQREAIENIRKLRNAAKKGGVRVLYTMHGETLSGWNANSDYELYADREAIRKTGKRTQQTSKLLDSEWNIIDELKPAPGEMILHKPRIDAFLGTDYHNLLRSLGIRTIVECGRSIDIGVEATARTAVLLGYLVVVVRDCIMGRNVEYVKDSMRWFERSVIVPKAEDIIQAWKK
jgi:nicotinamidase-related amidase